MSIVHATLALAQTRTPRTDAGKSKERAERVECGAYGTPPVVAAPQQGQGQPTPSNEDVTVYVTKTGKKYHRAGCSSLRKSANPMKLTDAIAAAYGPCQNCKPPVLKGP